MDKCEFSHVFQVVLLNMATFPRTVHNMETFPSTENAPRVSYRVIFSLIIAQQLSMRQCEMVG